MSGDERNQAVVHDAAACYRFVKATAAAAFTRSRGYPSYLPSTDKLLGSVRDLSSASLQFLSKFPSGIPDEPEAFRRYRGLLWLIRSTWRNLHFFVKPAVSADTLNVPTELVELLTKRVRALPGCESVEFALIHTDRLNYFHFPAGDFEQEAKSLSEIVHSEKQFPPDLGIIALPHSQSQHLFLNVLLAHEIGHYVFSRLKSIERLEKVLDAGLVSAFAPPKDVGLDASLRGSLPGVLQDWAEELFCDLFGVYLLGPTYVFASIEFFDLTSLDTQDGQIEEKASDPYFKFEWKHPAGLFRLWRQSELLERLGWWEEIRDIDSHFIKLIDASKTLHTAHFVFEKVGAPTGSNILDAFCRCLTGIEDEVFHVAKSLVDDKGKAFETKSFKDFRNLISLYLGHAVVPSTLRLNGTFETPSPIVLLNAAHLFYLSGIDGLLSKGGHVASDLEKRDLWMERVERWTTKALEDISMNAQQETQ